MSLPCTSQLQSAVARCVIVSSDAEDEMLRKLVSKTLKLHDELQEERRENEAAKLAVSNLLLTHNCSLIFPHLLID